jgi:hypothetical protein
MAGRSAKALFLRTISNRGVEQCVADKFAATFKNFPPVQKPNIFTINDAVAKMAEAAAGGST